MKTLANSDTWKNLAIGDVVFTCYRGKPDYLQDAKVTRIDADKENPELPPKSIEVIGSFGLNYDEPLADGTVSTLKIYFFRSIEEVSTLSPFVSYSTNVVDQLWIDPSSDCCEVGVEHYGLYTKEIVEGWVEIWWKDGLGPIRTMESTQKILEKHGLNRKAIAANKSQ